MPDIGENGVIDNVDGEQTPAQLAEERDVKALEKEYMVARKFDEEARKQYQIDRGYASGAKSKNWASDANLIGSFIDILTSFLYARDPDVTALAAKNVGGVDEDGALFAETAGIVVSRLWKKGRLKKAVRKQVRSALSVGPGWLKVILTHDTRIDPVVQKELNEVEEKVKMQEFLQEQLQSEEDEQGNPLDDEEISVKLAELNRVRKSLQSKLEKVHRTGLAIDYVNADDMTVSLDVADLSDHLEANWNANEIYIRTDQLRSRFPRLTAKDVQAAEQYHQVRPRKSVEQDAMFSDATADTSMRYKKGAAY